MWLLWGLRCQGPWVRLLYVPLSQASLTSQDYALAKCFLPQEDTVLATYFGVLGLLVVVTLAHLERLALPFPSGWTVLRTHRAR